MKHRSAEKKSPLRRSGRPVRPASAGGLAPGYVAVTLLSGLLGAKWVGGFEQMLLLISFVNSWILFVLFALDKSFARRGDARIPERDLHGWEFFGGWPGGLAGLMILHHKSAKKSYQAVLGLILLCHALLLYCIVRYPAVPHKIFCLLQNGSRFLYSLAGL